MTYTISKEDMAALLDRPLTSGEDSNYNAVLATAKSTLESILGIKLDGSGTRIYLPRTMYSQLWTDPFVGMATVAVVDADGTTDITSTPAYYDDLNAPWFNSVILDSLMGNKKIAVTANWGFGDELPIDLKALWASLFGLVTEAAASEATGAITSEQILTHKVTYAASSSDAIQRWSESNTTTIARYAGHKNVIYGGDSALPRYDYDL